MLAPDTIAAARAGLADMGAAAAAARVEREARRATIAAGPRPKVTRCTVCDRFAVWPARYCSEACHTEANGR